MQPTVTIAIININIPATIPRAAVISWQEVVIMFCSVGLAIDGYTVTVVYTVSLVIMSEWFSDGFDIELMVEQGIHEDGVGISVTVDGVHPVCVVSSL